LNCSPVWKKLKEEFCCLIPIVDYCIFWWGACSQEYECQMHKEAAIDLDYFDHFLFAPSAFDKPAQVLFNLMNTWRTTRKVAD
jgi:hypothetical protein